MNRNTPLIVLVAFMCLLAVGAIVVIIIRKSTLADELTLIGAIVAFMVPLLTSLIALLRAETANVKADTVTTVINGHVNDQINGKA